MSLKELQIQFKVLQKKYNLIKEEREKLRDDNKKKDKTIKKITKEHKHAKKILNLRGFNKKYVEQLKELEEELNRKREEIDLIISEKTENEKYMKSLQVTCSNLKENYDKVCKIMKLEKEKWENDIMERDLLYELKIKTLQEELNREKENNQFIAHQKNEMRTSQENYNILNDDIENKEDENNDEVFDDINSETQDEGIEVKKEEDCENQLKSLEDCLLNESLLRQKLELQIENLQKQYDLMKEELILKENEIINYKTSCDDMKLQIQYETQLSKSEEEDMLQLKLQYENLQEAFCLKQEELIKKEEELENYTKSHEKAIKDFNVEKERYSVAIQQKDITIENLKGIIKNETEKYQNTVEDLKRVNKQLFEKNKIEELSNKSQISTKKMRLENEKGEADNCNLTNENEKLQEVTTDTKDLKKHENKSNSKSLFYKFFSIIVILVVSCFLLLYYDYFEKITRGEL